jgi:hypothetical protein
MGKIVLHVRKLGQGLWDEATYPHQAVRTESRNEEQGPAGGGSESVDPDELDSLLRLP